METDEISYLSLSNVSLAKAFRPRTVGMIFGKNEQKRSANRACTYIGIQER